MLCALSVGEVAVTVAETLSNVFLITRGIKQGCPASPTVFGILLAGLQNWLARVYSDSVLYISDVVKSKYRYADNIELIATFEACLNSLFGGLAQFGIPGALYFH